MYQKLAAMPNEEDDVSEKEYLFNREGKTKLTTNQYGYIIKKFLHQKKIGQALDVLETRMLKDDKVKPENYIYNLLIGACGQVGYTKKAFQLFNQMKERDLKVTGHTYTGLFNACANSPYPEDGLRRARNLQGQMLEKGVLLNQTIYHAMIKAYGRCGDLETAFMLVDEMLEKKIKVSDETFNFLLQACISDKTAGFRHALLVWRKMMQKRVRPSLYSFNLLLRCSRDCGLGDEETTKETIQVLLQAGPSNSRVRLNAGSADQEPSSQMTIASESETTPNLISQIPTMGSVVAVSKITRPEHRLMLMGGSRGVLKQMRLCQVKPDIKTFTQLMDQIPSTLEAEIELLNAVRESKIQMDVDFCNMLMRKRCLRGDYENGKEVLRIIHFENLRPDIITFGVLAMACQTLSSALQLLQDIDNVGYRPNVEILGTLVKNACYGKDCDFVSKMMSTLEKEGLKPNDKFLNHLDNFYIFALTALNKKPTANNEEKLKLEKFAEFCENYEGWRQEMRPDAPPHPWARFREKSVEGPEDIELMNYGRVKYSTK